MTNKEKLRPRNSVNPWTIESNVSWACNVSREVGRDGTGRWRVASLTIDVSVIVIGVHLGFVVRS